MTKENIKNTKENPLNDFGNPFKRLQKTLSMTEQTNDPKKIANQMTDPFTIPKECYLISLFQMASGVSNSPKKISANLSGPREKKWTNISRVSTKLWKISNSIILLPSVAWKVTQFEWFFSLCSTSFRSILSRVVLETWKLFHEEKQK